MTDLQLDNLMGRVLSDAIRLDFERTERQTAVFQPSARHQKQITAMLADPLRWVKLRERTLWKAALQKVAIVLLVIAIGFGGVMAFSAPARAAVVRWVVEWYETHIIYRHSGEDIAGALPKYEITDLPEGYKEVDRFEDPASASIMYEDGRGGFVVLDYNFSQEGVANSFMTSDDDIREVRINDWKGQLFIPKDPGEMKTITWIDEKVNIQFVIIADFDEAGMVSTAEKVFEK